MSRPHWFKGHMAAYIRPRTVQVRKKPQIECQVTNRIKLFLSNQLDQTHNKLRKIEEHFTNPNHFQKQDSSQIHGNGVSSQRFDDESSSLSYLLCNSSTKSIAGSIESNAITEEKGLRRKGKEIRRFWANEEEEEYHRFISGFQARISRNRIKSKHSEDSNPNLRIKPGENQKNLPLRTQEH